MVGGLGALFRSVVFVHGQPSAAHASAVWGALMLASFAGWGSGLNTLLFPRDRADWGLRCAWGWAIAVGAGGFLCAVGLATRPALIALVGLGLLVLCLQVAQAVLHGAGNRAPSWRRLQLFAADGPFLLGALAVLGLAAVQGGAMILAGTFNHNDDNIAYFHFVHEILDRGTLTQPFSARRITTYGGQALLHAVQIAIDVPETHLHLLDRGLALLTVLALLVGHARTSRRSARGIVLLAMLFAATLPDVRWNIGSTMTGVLFFLALYRTLDWLPLTRAHGVRQALPVALLAAGACALRQNYLAPVGVLLVVVYARAMLRRDPRTVLRFDRAGLFDTATTAGILFVVLAPWWLLAYRWSGTFLFPLLKGNYNTSYALFPSHTPLEWLQYFWENFCFGVPVKGVPMFLAAALTMPRHKPNSPLSALVLASFLAFVLLLVGFPSAHPEDQCRYYYGFTVAAILAIALAASEVVSNPSLSPRRKAAAGACVALVVAGISLQVYEDRAVTASSYKAFLGAFTTPVARWTRSTLEPSYRALQAPVPPGDPIAVMVDDPGHFDERRNRIASLDIVGAVSPPPGIPLAAGAEAVAAYLLDQGYRYLVVVHPDKAAELYRRDKWIANQQRGAKVWQASARFYLDAFDDFDALRASRAHLADVNGNTTLDLATRQR
jgi:hypothetical protein